MNTEQKQTEHQMLMEFIEQDCSVDITKKIPYPPVALSYGEKLIRTSKEDILVPIALGTFGNLSVITAPPKTMKTFFVSLLASAFLSGTNIYGGQIKGHRKDGHLIHFDTEQGQWHAAKVFRRPLDMDSNIPQDKYHTFALRTVAFKERLEFIEYYLSERIDEPSLVIIDGIADNVHIINVIHQNYGSQKLGTGHLGSALEKKAETVISLEANTVNKEWVTVRCGRSRGYCFETFSFKVNEKGLPTIVDDLYDPLK